MKAADVFFKHCRNKAVWEIIHTNREALILWLIATGNFQKIVVAVWEIFCIHLIALLMHLWAPNGSYCFGIFLKIVLKCLEIHW